MDINILPYIYMDIKIYFCAEVDHSAVQCVFCFVLFSFT